MWPVVALFFFTAIVFGYTGARIGLARRRQALQHLKAQLAMDEAQHGELARIARALREQSERQASGNGYLRAIDGGRR